MRRWLVALIAGACCACAAAALMEFGIEGFGVVSTPHSEIKASIHPDGGQIVWGSTGR